MNLRPAFSWLAASMLCTVAASNTFSAAYGSSKSRPANPEATATDCSALHLHLDGQDAQVQSEERTISKAEAPVLRIIDMKNGAVQFEGWDNDVYSVTLCKGAAGDNSEVQQLFSQMHLSVQNGAVSVSEPSEHSHWTVVLIVRTPRSAAIEATTKNGPVSFRHVDGKITAHTTNGPVSIKDCSCEADVSAENGPISYDGGGGSLHFHAKNGPISVSLNESWQGSELVGDTQNGPLTLKVPTGFHSSFLLESKGNGPVGCNGSICSETRRISDDEKQRIEYGSQPAVIRLSTVNGPVAIKTGS